MRIATRPPMILILMMITMMTMMILMTMMLLRIATRPPSQTRRDSAHPVSSPSSGCEDYFKSKGSDDSYNYDVFDDYDGSKDIFFDDGIYIYI